MLDHPGVLGGWKRSIKNRVRVRGTRGREMPRMGTMKTHAMTAVVSEAQGF